MGLVLALTATTMHRAHAQSAGPSSSALIEVAQDSYQRGRFAEALGLYQRAREQGGNVELELDVARAAEADEQPQVALSAYERYLSSKPDTDKREFVEARIGKLRRASAQASAAPRQLEPEHQVELTLASSATPKPPKRVLQLHAGLKLGLARPWVSDYLTNNYSYDYATFRFGTTLGLEAGVSLVWRFFGLGLEARALWLGTPDVSDSTQNPSTASGEVLRSIHNVVLKPRIGDKNASESLELYAALPHGVGGTGGHGARLVIGAVAGGTYFFEPHLGVNVEFGYTWYIDPQLYGEALTEFTLCRASIVYGH